MTSRIINFLRGSATDYLARKLTELQNLPDHQLERCHNVVQWMFPTDIPSKFYQDAPVLTPEDIETIQNDLVIQGAIQLSLTRMIWFYQANNYWLTQKNHNYLRITRILRCLWLANLKHDYVSMQKVLDDIFIDYPDIIGEETYLYWKNANNDIFLKQPDKLPTPLRVSLPSAVEVANALDEDLDQDPYWFGYT